MSGDESSAAKKFSLFDQFRQNQLNPSEICTQDSSSKPSSSTNTARQSIQIPDSWRLGPESAVKSDSEKRPTHSSSSSLLISDRQRGNPVLTFIKNIPWTYSDIGPDFLFGKDLCGYYISMRYHNLNPEYISERMGETKTIYSHRILIAHVDMEEPSNVVKDLNKFCFSKNLTLVVAWTNEEVARYLESYKMFQNKTLDGLVPEKKGITNGVDKFQDDIVHFLTGLKKVSKSDAVNMISQFKTVADVIRASSDKLEELPGFGRLKATKVYSEFHKPFKRTDLLHHE